MSKKYSEIRLIILDRDGVINEDSDHFVKNVAEFRLLPGSLEAIVKLNQAGIQIAVATNQSGLARGLFCLDVLDAMHEKLTRLVSEAGGHISFIAYCPHGPHDACLCRKPKPGLLLQISQYFSIPFEHILVVGDSLRDLQAAEAVKALPVLVLSGKGAKTLKSHPELVDQVDIYPDLAYFAADFLKNII